MDVKLLYPDFDWEEYKKLNSSLYFLKNQKEYEEHYIRVGRYNGFHYKKSNIPSIHILIATIGKESLFPLLEKLKTQMKEEDYLTIVFDGIQYSKNYEKVKEVCSYFKCHTNIIVEQKNLGFWGHGIRNKHKNLSGDFVYHIDDDDMVLDNTLDTIKKICTDNRFVYIFKIMLKDSSIIWKQRKVILGQISTQCGLIPTSINKMGYWKLVYGGDYTFYKLLSLKYPFLYINKLIYQKF